MEENLLKSSDQIQDSIKNITKEINTKFADKEVELIALNLAPRFFIQDLLKRLEIPVRLQSLTFEHYSQSSESGEVNITKDLEFSVFDKHLIVVDGIIISGNTLFYISNYLKQRMPKSISIVCVGIKPKLLNKKLPNCYSLFNFNNEWVEGYGIGGEEYSSEKYLVDLKKSL
tara:strand:+ start:103 stop:618 length:516 start_codon:yes stop_codon:yes gene_type:complete